MKKNSVYIFVLLGFIFMASTAVYLVNSISAMSRIVSITSSALFLVSLCGLYFFRWKAGIIFKEAADKKQLKVLAILEFTKKIWILLILICIAAMILKHS